MLAILKQPIPRGFHLMVIRSFLDLPQTFHPDAQIAPVANEVELADLGADGLQRLADELTYRPISQLLALANTNTNKRGEE